MALTMKGASIGHDGQEAAAIATRVSGLQDMILTDFDAGLIELNTSIDEIWKGESADAFKNNMQIDEVAIKKAVSKLFYLITFELNEVSGTMQDIDRHLIVKKGAA